MIESKTARKNGWGKSRWRSVTHLTSEERYAVRFSTALIWFRFVPWHYTQSGFKIVIQNGDRFDSREPSSDQLLAIKAAIKASTCP
jgi:hypothetical protein